MSLAPSELILNQDGSIYHLNLLPKDIAKTIITVGDPDRVKSITKYFDTVEISRQKREFLTETGTLSGKKITVISTGIGTDNIDIVLNELDALVNIDFKTRTIKSNLTSLEIIRIGTSGAIQKDIDVDSFLVSEIAIGLDSLLHYYENNDYYIEDQYFSLALNSHLSLKEGFSKPYLVRASQSLMQKFKHEKLLAGVTATNVGFYGPQGRVLRLSLRDGELNKKLESFSYKNKRITNLEMETAGIYAMSSLLGHQAISLNAILANRATGDFSKSPDKTVSELIEFALKILTE